MAYSELIKNFDRIRDYMRQFYVYGFRSRNAYDKKSARSYDNGRRRIESWLGLLYFIIVKKEKSRMTVFTGHPAGYEIGSQRPKHSLSAFPRLYFGANYLRVCGS